METSCKNKGLENSLVTANVLVGMVVAATFISLFGFPKPLVDQRLLYMAQVVALCYFLAEKILRTWNAVEIRQYWRANWFEIPLALVLAVVLVGAWSRMDVTESEGVRHFAVGVYLVIQVVIKGCRTTVRLAALGRNPTRTMIASFVVLILIGAVALMLPKASAGPPIGVVDALFTATSAACVTGLTVRDTGADFSVMGQVVILALIQLGGLGIVVFSAVLALLLRQAFTVRESVAMQDLLSGDTLSRIGTMIGFVFATTVLVEALGALGLYWMWDNDPGWVGSVQQQWFLSAFHSISAFCNAGFGLFSDNLIRYRPSWGIYAVICPLIVIGGLGFSVLYNLWALSADRVQWWCKRWWRPSCRLTLEVPKRMSLQTKIVLVLTVLLIVLGAAAVFTFEKTVGLTPQAERLTVPDALFHSVTARTAGFNTVDIAALTEASKLVLIVLMFIGGSPGGTAGGIKTVTAAIIVMAVVATLRKRGEVEVFRRAIAVSVVGRAITIQLLFFTVLLTSILGLNVTERGHGFGMMDLAFEATSALGTVGLSTGVTGYLTIWGKLIIMALMLIGRLGPLTLVAALTFNIRPPGYNYPHEAVIVG